MKQQVVRVVALVLILAGYLSVISTYAQDKTIDSLRHIVENHQQRDTVRVMNLNLLSYYSVDLEKSKAYADEALEISLELSHKKGTGRAYFQLSNYYWKKTDSHTSIHYAFEAIKLFEECMPAGLGVCYGMLGLNYSELGEFDKALYYHRLALAIDEKNGNQRNIAADLNNMGTIYFYHKQKQNYDSAVHYFLRSLDVVTSRGDRSGIMLAYNNLGSTYCRKGQYQLAMTYLNKALPMAIELDNADRLSLIHQSFGELYLSLRLYNNAHKHFEAALGIAHDIGNKKRKEEVYEQLKDLALLNKNYKLAFEYQNDLSHLRDTLYNFERSRQIAEMQTIYDTERKEQTIKVLEQEKRLEAIWRNVLIAGVVLTVLGAWLIFTWQRYRTRKANQLLEAELVLNAKLKELDKLKSELYTNIAHEFRTPLTLILAPLENELKKASEGKENLLLIRRSANRLLELINQLLDLSRLESGKMSMNIIHGDLKQLLTVITTSFDALADNKQIRFIKTIAIEKSWCWFDQDKVEKIITNLLSNAFKFTPSGGTVMLEIRSSDDQSISLTVSDTGPGIATDEQSRIFLPFYQVRQISGSQQGSGLGLSLVKELVRLYNGTLSLDSHPASGTSFRISLPINKESFASEDIGLEESIIKPPYVIEELTKEDESSPRRQGSSPICDYCVLVVEDNDDMRRFIATVLRDNGYAVMSARNGKEALRLAQNHIPSLIVSDLMMPYMDGIEFTRRIKNDERTSHIPVILLTAKNEHQSRLHGLKTGADDYLTKPFSPEEVVIRIENLIEIRKKLTSKFRERISAPAKIPPVSLDDSFLQKAKDVVEVNLADGMFTVEKMADDMNLSHTQLLRKLKALTGISPNDFIKDIRLKRAADMITHRVNSLSRIGYAVGFTDQSYFTKCFKKQYGVTPTEYSLQHAVEKKDTLQV